MRNTEIRGIIAEGVSDNEGSGSPEMDRLTAKSVMNRLRQHGCYIVSEVDNTAHYIWSAAQLAPGESIQDGVDRIAKILRGE